VGVPVRAPVRDDGRGAPAGTEDGQGRRRGNHAARHRPGEGRRVPRRSERSPRGLGQTDLRAAVRRDERALERLLRVQPGRHGTRADSFHDRFPERVRPRLPARARRRRGQRGASPARLAARRRRARRKPVAAREGDLEPQGYGNPNIPANSAAAYYPGNRFVDVVGNDLYNQGNGGEWAANDRLYAAHPSKPYAIVEWANWAATTPRSSAGWQRSRVRTLASSSSPTTTAAPARRGTSRDSRPAALPTGARSRRSADQSTAARSSPSTACRSTAAKRS
jgi:hypothetical protein